MTEFSWVIHVSFLEDYTKSLSLFYLYLTRLGLSNMPPFGPMFSFVTFCALLGFSCVSSAWRRDYHRKSSCYCVAVPMETFWWWSFSMVNCLSKDKETSKIMLTTMLSEIGNKTSHVQIHGEDSKEVALVYCCSHSFPC